MIQTFYDMVKARGGEIQINIEPGRGAEFKIILPGNNLKLPLAEAVIME